MTVRAFQGAIDFFAPLAAGSEVIGIEPVLNPACGEIKSERLGKAKNPCANN